MKVSFGFILLIAGILGIARGGVDSPEQNLGHLGQMIGTGPGVASFVTLAAAFFLVGGLLILAKTGRFSFEGSRGDAKADAGRVVPPLRAADVHSANENT